MSHFQPPAQQQQQWHPPAPSLASLPVDRTKTEPKPAFYKLQFGDDVTGFSYYVRTLTVMIGRNCDGKGVILPPPDERNLGGPTIPPLGFEELVGVDLEAEEKHEEKPAVTDLQPDVAVSVGQDEQKTSEQDLEGKVDELKSAGRDDFSMEAGEAKEAQSAGAGPVVDAEAFPNQDGDITMAFGDVSAGLADSENQPRAASEDQVEIKVEHVEPETLLRTQSPAHPSASSDAPPTDRPASQPEQPSQSAPAGESGEPSAAAEPLSEELISSLADAAIEPPPGNSPGLDPAALEALALAATSDSPPPPPPPPPANPASNSLEHVDVDLGPLKSVSRNHAKISYMTELGHFCLEIYGRNGAWVDDRYFVRGSIVPLNQGSQIQIATRIFSFILPPGPDTSPYNTPYESYSLEELPYPYNLPAQDLGYQEFYGEAGPGPSSAAALATRFPEQYNVFTAPDGHGLGLAMNSHGWLNDWSDGSGSHSDDSDSDSDDDSDEEDDDEDGSDEEDEESDVEEPVVEEKPKPTPKIKLKVKRPPRLDSEMSNLTSDPDGATPAPAPATQTTTAKSKTASKDAAATDSSNPAASKKTSPQKQDGSVAKPPPKPKKQTAKAKAAAAAAAAAAADADAPAVKDETMVTDPATLSAVIDAGEEGKDQSSGVTGEDKADGSAKDTKPKAKATGPKSEKAKTTPAKKESKKKAKPAVIAPAPAATPVATLASAVAAMPDSSVAPPAPPATVSTPAPAPAPAPTLAAIEALNPTPTPPVRPIQAPAQPPPPVRPPPPGTPATARPPPPPASASAPGPVRPPPPPPGPTAPATPQAARPPAIVRPPLNSTPSSSNTGTPEPVKPFILTELIETPGRPGHIQVNVPIPPSGAGPRPPPGPLIGLDAKPFIGPPPIKPTATFATIIHRALLFLPRGRGTLGEVCNWVAGEWEWFRLNIDAGWQNSIRHNLSLNKAFLKVPRIPEDDPESKGSVWIIDPKEGPKFEEKQRKDALKAEGKGKNSDVRREKERIRVEERQKKLREGPHDQPSHGPSGVHPHASQMAHHQQRPLAAAPHSHAQAHHHPHAQSHAQQAQHRPPIANAVRPTPRPVNTQSTTGISKGLPAKGKIAVTITPITAALRQKSVIATTDQTGKPLPFTCDGSTLSLDQQTFGHLTADILEKLTVLGPAQAVEVISAWVINKNKQMAAAASAGKAGAGGAASARPTGATGTGAGAGRPPHAQANGTAHGQAVRPGTTAAAANPARPPPARPAAAPAGQGVQAVRPPPATQAPANANNATSTSAPRPPAPAPANASSTAAPTTASAKVSPAPAPSSAGSAAPTTITIKGKVIGAAPPGASLTRVISMIAEVANAKGDVNIVGPNASALLRYIRVVGVDIDLKVADRIWATGIVPPLSLKKGQAVVNGKPAGTATSAGGSVGKPGVAATGVKPAASTPTTASAPVPAATVGVKRKLESDSTSPAPPVPALPATQTAPTPETSSAPSEVKKAKLETAGA